MGSDPPATAQAQARARAWAWILLASRPALFLAAQAAIVLVLAASGVREPWWSSAAWWPVAGTFANVAGLLLLAWRGRVEGIAWRGWLPSGGRGWRREASVALALAPVIAAAAALPPIWLGTALWGDPAVGHGLLHGPLPGWATWVALLLFPATVAAVELPTYAGYVLPKLRAGGLPVAVAVAVVGLVFGIQHGALPFLPASQFFVWRTTAFVPVALLLIAALAWRPKLLPWLVGVHVLFDVVVLQLVWWAPS